MNEKTLDLRDSLKFASSATNYKSRNIGDTFAEAISLGANIDDTMKIAKEANNIIYKHASDVYEAALNSGVSRIEANKILKDSQLNIEEARAVSSFSTPKFKMTERQGKIIAKKNPEAINELYSKRIYAWSGGKIIPASMLKR